MFLHIKSFLQKYGIVLVIAAQLLVVLGLAFSQQLVIDKGLEVHLSLVPRDPRDQFRGDYVVLNYNISSVDYNRNGSYDSKPNVGDTVYVTLNNYSSNRNNWSVYSVELDKNDVYSGNNYVTLAGQITSINFKGNCTIDDTNSNNYCYREQYQLRVNYGIETYYIPEGSGQNLPSFQNAYAIVFVDQKSYKPVLKEVRIDGKKWPQ